MRTLSDRIEIVETRSVGDVTFEICATALAAYDDDSSKLSITLRSFLRRVNMRGADEYLHPAWLPKDDTVVDSVSLEEASTESKEVFHRWARKVRESIPAGDEFQSSLQQNHPRAIADMSRSTTG